jgi:hypothetical protein
VKAVLWLGATLVTTTAALASPKKKAAVRPPAQWMPADSAASQGSGKPALVAPNAKPPKPQRPAAAQPTPPDPEDITADLESLYREGTYEGSPPPPEAELLPPAPADAGATADAASASEGTGADELRGPPAGAAASPGTAQAPDWVTEPTAEEATLDQAPLELFPHDEEEPLRAAAQTSLGLQKTAQAPAGEGGFGSQFGLGVAGVLEQTAKYAHVPDHDYESLIATHMEMFYAGVSEWTRWELYGQLAIYDFRHEDETRATPMLFAAGPGGRFGLSRRGFDWLVGAGYAMFMGDFRGTPPAEAGQEPEKTPRQVGCGVASTTLRSPLPASAGRVFYTLQGHFCGQDWQQATGYRDGVYAHVLGLEASG